VGEECIFLKNGVDVALVGRDVVDALAVKDNVALVGALEAADDAKRRGFSTARRAEKRDKFLVMDDKINVVENGFSVKAFGNVFELNQYVLIHSAINTPLKKEINTSLPLLSRVAEQRTVRTKMAVTRDMLVRATPFLWELSERSSLYFNRQCPKMQ
jgi:hypothetical protein